MCNTFLNAIFWRRKPSTTNGKAGCGSIVWRRKKDSEQFVIDEKCCIYSCLKSKAYIEGSREYTFEYGCGAVGRVWFTKKSEIINTHDCNLGEFYRRDLARLHGFKSVLIVWIEDGLILESFHSDHISQLDTERLLTPTSSPARSPNSSPYGSPEKPTRHREKHRHSPS